MRPLRGARFRADEGQSGSYAFGSFELNSAGAASRIDIWPRFKTLASRVGVLGTAHWTEVVKLPE